MSPAIITLLILVVAIIIFISDRLPMGLVAFMVPMALYFLGLLVSKISLRQLLMKMLSLSLPCACWARPFSKQG